MTFAFFDFETTGVNPAFDQALQFAAVLTDDTFLEICQVNIRCRLKHWIQTVISMKAFVRVCVMRAPATKIFL